MDRTIDDLRRAYDSEAIAARYDSERFSSMRARLYVARQHQLLRRCLGRFGRIERLLDLPCGTGRLLALGAGAASVVVGVDAAGAMLAQATGRSAAAGAALCRGDAMQLPLRSRGVDVVLCVRFLHLLPPAAVEAVLAELARVARRGAVVAIQVSYPADRLTVLRRRLLRRPPVVAPPPSLAEWGARCTRAGLTLAEAHRVWPGVSDEAVVVLRR